MSSGGTSETDEVLRQLLARNYDPTMLASALDVPIEDVLALVPPERLSVAAADAELQLAYRQLAWRALEECARILDEGTPAMKMRLLTKLTGDLGKAIAVNDRDELADMRAEFQALTAQIRGE